MKNTTSESNILDTQTTRRQVVMSIGLGGIAMQFPNFYANSHKDIKLNSEQLHYKSITEVSELIRTRKITSVDLTKMMFKRISDIDGNLHSYVTFMKNEAIASATLLDKEMESGIYRGPLHGIPIGIKDLLFTKGIRTMAGTTVYSDFIPDYNSTVVEKLEAAGSVILGKLTLCEGAMAPYNPKLKVPVNPWDLTRWSGLSSSGSGVATTSGLCFGSIGTDTGGSIRYPSAANGCVGLKPTYGRVSRRGVFALAESMDHVGPMTRTVEDAVIMLDTIAGFDQKDPTSLKVPSPSIRGKLKRGIKGLRIGFDHNYSSYNVDADIVQGIKIVLDELKELGAEIVDVTMPDVSNSGSVWYTLCTAEAVLANEKTFPSRADEFSIGFQEDLNYGMQVSGVDYARASSLRDALSGRIIHMLDDIDCMVCPSMSSSAPIKTVDPAKMSGKEWKRLNKNDNFTKPFNLCGVPTLSVPCGFSKDGLPLSVQFVGSLLDEETICRVGYEYQNKTKWHEIHPDI